MVDVMDLLQCPVCGTFYAPETTATGRMVPHCALPVEHGLSPGQLVERGATTRVRWLDGEVYVDWRAIERRLLAHYGLTDPVEGLPLTGSLLDIEV